MQKYAPGKIFPLPDVGKEYNYKVIIDSNVSNEILWQSEGKGSIEGSCLNEKQEVAMDDLLTGAWLKKACLGSNPKTQLIMIQKHAYKLSMHMYIIHVDD